MGFVYVDIEIQKHVDAPKKGLRVLVDTGANFNIIPRPILEELGIEPTGKRPFELADGTVIWRDIAPAVIRYQGEPGGTPVAFGEAADEPVMGVFGLGALGLQVDPGSGQLTKARLKMVTVR